MSVDAPVRWPAQVVWVAGALAVAAGLLAGAGWMFGIDALVSLAPGWPRMSVPTVLASTLLGLALCLQAAAGPWWQRADGSQPRRALPVWLWAAQVCGAASALVGLVRLVSYLTGWDLGLDRQGHMSPATAAAVLLLGSAQLLLSRPHPVKGALLPAVLAMLVGLLGASRYLFGGPPLFAYAQMALHTALVVLVLGAGTLCTRPDQGLMRLLTGASTASAATRVLLPAVILVPLAMGWFALHAQRSGSFGPEAGVSLFALLSIVLLGTTVWSGAVLVDRSDTHRRRAEAARREQQELLQAIVDNTAAAIYAKDLQGRYLLVNRRCAELFQLHGDAAIGRTDHELFPRDTAEALREADQRAADAQLPIAEEESVPQVGGQRTLLSVKGPLRDSAGRVQGVFGVSTDITERRLAQQRQQEQLERLSLLDEITRAIGARQDIQSIHQVVIRSLEERLPADFACVCSYDNEKQRLTVVRVGVRSEALVLELALGESRALGIDEDGLSRCVRGELVYEADTAQAAFPFSMCLARAGLRAVVLAPLQSEAQVTGVLIAARRESQSFGSDDREFLRQLSAHVSLAAHQAELHAALQSAYEELKQTQQAVLQQERLRALGQMASGIAHDINNAISPIMLYAESLLEREGGLSPEGRAQLQAIARSIDDVAATVARMREFYRPRQSQLMSASVALNPLVRQVAELTRARWSDMPQQRGIAIHLEMALDPNVPMVMGVESEIREALINLVFNAVDAMPDGGALTMRTLGVRSEAGLRYGQVEVQDSGVGMDEETQRRCLEPFFTTKGERGTGLGLAMVYGTAQRHRAVLDIRSALGRGSTLTLRFPSPGVTASTVTPAPPVAQVAPMRILVVDDDPMVLKVLQGLLGFDGHSVVAVNGGQAGIDTFRGALAGGGCFDLVITDLGMPHVDGYKVADAVKQVSPLTGVIMLTGWGPGNAGDVPLNVDLMLGKPPTLQDLRRALADFQPSALTKGAL